MSSQNKNMLLFADQLIQQVHYKHMDQVPLHPVDAEIEKIPVSSITCIFQIKELVCSKEKGNFDAFSVVLNALHACGATCMMLLEFREGLAELYIGAVNKNRYQNVYYLNTIREILRSGLQGNLPGTEIKELVTRQEIEDKLAECMADGFDTQCITSVSCVADQFKEDKPVYGMEKMLGAIGKKNFSLLVLADPINSDQLQTIRTGYEELFSQLSGLESVSVSVQTSKNVSVSKNVSDSINRSISESISHTQSHNVSNGWSRGQSSPDDEAKKNLGKKAMAGAGAVAISALIENPMAGYMFMNAVSPMVNGGSQNSGTNGSESNGTSDGHTQSEQIGDSHQEGVGYSQGETEGLSVQFTKKNRHVHDLLNKADSYLKWINKCENYGMFNCCAYIISGSASTNLLVSSQYQALLQGEGERNQPVTFNTWTKENNVDTVRDALLHFIHPTILRGNVEISPAMLISSRELARQMILPQESVVGVSVMEYASFGKEVVRKSPMKSGNVAKIGLVSHMGKTDQNQPVFLDLQSLAAHTFIAGTNGSGKSNTIFCILEELLEANIPFMVIEPAKGEYKNVFGKEKNVSVYGTNKQKTPLLRLNPFWFHEDINVKEHISRLMDVFNASWPMYAAMPSVLNAAIENAYKMCGWNLNTSRCVRNRIFPTVKDVQIALNEKMESTAFSDEVRGNYIGALSTRLESLCNGIYTDIFSGADLGDRALFDSNVLIDLSRAGSPEISAMIMGIILIRLREYRMREGAINHPLRHITVLEEAHHLLRKTSVEQSDEGSNIMGKAVEMIANAIAEMRSYGDGFMIADQSPGLLDMSVLRNTNTKIAMRLPEGGDRETVGSTMGLTQKQTFELSRLKTGVCAIYQKDWLESVLCQVHLAKHKEELYAYQPIPDEEDRRHQQLLKNLLAPFMGGNDDIGQDDQLICDTALSGIIKKKLLSMKQLHRVSWKRIAGVLCEVEPLNLELPFEHTEEDYHIWFKDSCAVHNLPDAGISRMILAANVRMLCEKDQSWQKLSDWLYTENENSVICSIRGKALSWVFFDHEDGTDGSELSDREIEELKTGWDADKKLLEVYLRYQETGKRRCRGEIIPYAEIAWAYAGGETVWMNAYRALVQCNYPEWDRLVRTELLKNVNASERTIDTLLSLMLQNKGSNKEVRTFYYPWLAWIRKNHRIILTNSKVDGSCG